MKEYHRCANASERIEWFAATLPRLWTREMSAYPNGWTKENPAWGQADITTLLLHNHFHGPIFRTTAFSDGLERAHYFLVVGEDDLDLTQQQFPEETRFIENADPALRSVRRMQLIHESAELQYRYGLLVLAVAQVRLQERQACGARS